MAMLQLWLQYYYNILSIFMIEDIDWLHLSTLGTRGGELAPAQPYALGRLRGLERWRCNLGICDGVACCRNILEGLACVE
jgi:hypothetical protein